MDKQLETIAGALRERTPIERSLIVGIDGFGGAGKSTLAGRLAAVLGDAAVVAMDDFIVKDHMADDSWENGWDRHRLARQVLEPVREGVVARMQKFIWETNSLGPFAEIPRRQYLIVEGLTSLHPQIAGFYDYSIWVDTPIEVSKERGQARDAGTENEFMWDLWASNDLRYAREYEPKGRADVVVSGEVQ